MRNLVSICRADVTGRAPWLVLVLLACGALALAGGLGHRPGWTIAAVVLLLLAWLPRVWRQRRKAAIIGWLALALVVLAPSLTGHVGLALMALPVVFLGIACAWFALSLRAGAEPLIVRFVRVAEGAARIEAPRVRTYARGVTLFWAVLLAVLAAWSLLLALFAQPGGWFAVFGWPAPIVLPGSMLAWYPEAGCWGVLAAAFAGEYAFRRWYLRGIPQASIFGFAAQLVKYWPELLRGGGRA